MWNTGDEINCFQIRNSTSKTIILYHHRESNLEIQYAILLPAQFHVQVTKIDE